MSRSPEEAPYQQGTSGFAHSSAFASEHIFRTASIVEAQHPQPVYDTDLIYNTDLITLYWWMQLFQDTGLMILKNRPAAEICGLHFAMTCKFVLMQLRGFNVPVYVHQHVLVSMHAL